MNKLLSLDFDRFERQHPNAAAFLQAAHLRHEAYNLICARNRGEKIDAARLEELLNAPACQDNEFLTIYNRGG